MDTKSRVERDPRAYDKKEQAMLHTESFVGGEVGAVDACER